MENICHHPTRLRSWVKACPQESGLEFHACVKEMTKRIAAALKQAELHHFLNHQTYMGSRG